MKDKRLKENTIHHRVAPRLQPVVKKAGTVKKKKTKKTI